MPESPKFLVSKKDYQGAVNTYNFIARMNNKQEMQLNRETIRFKDEKSKDKKQLRILFKKLSKEQNQGFQNNIKASLAAQKDNVIDEVEDESSSDEESEDSQV